MAFLILPLNYIYESSVVFVLVHNVYIRPLRILCMKQTSPQKQTVSSNGSFLFGDPDQDYSLIVEVKN